MSEASTGDGPGFLRGINIQSVPSLAAERFIAAAAEAGFDGVELTGESVDDQARVAASLADARLRLFGVSPSPRLYDWHWRWDAATQDRFRAELDTAAELGAGYFVMPFMRDRGDARSVAAGLSQAIPYARECGIELAVEPIGHHDVLRRLEDLVPVLAALDGTGVLLDSFHFFRAGHAISDVGRVGDIPVRGLQVSNANGRPREELIGYRDRTFPLDGRFDVAGLVDRVRAEHPAVPVIVEVIGEVAARTPVDTAFSLAREQLDTLAGASDRQIVNDRGGRT